MSYKDILTISGNWGACKNACATVAMPTLVCWAKFFIFTVSLRTLTTFKETPELSNISLCSLLVVYFEGLYFKMDNSGTHALY